MTNGIDRNTGLTASPEQEDDELVMRDLRPVDTAGRVPADHRAAPVPVGGRATHTLVARARAGDAAARRLLVQRVGGSAGNGAAAAVATAPSPQPCDLTPTTVIPVVGDLSDDDALEATRHLPDFVQNGNGGAWQLTTDCRRREFMRWAREWFGTYRDAIAHYNGLDHATGIPGSPVVAAAVGPRLQAVAAELGADMPSTTVAFSFRANFHGAHPAGTSMHTLGYALDYDATLMPRIGRDETALLIELMTGGKAAAQILDYSRRRAAIKRMGDRTATATDPTSGDTTAATVIRTLNTELTRVSAASTAFQSILGAHTADFLELRTQYFEADVAHKPAILAQVQPLIQPFYDAITHAEAEPDLAGPRRSLLATLRTMLQTDATFLFGHATHPRAPRARRGEPAPPTPRPGTALEVSGPSLAQLLEHGWFHPAPAASTGESRSRSRCCAMGSTAGLPGEAPARTRCTSSSSSTARSPHPSRRAAKQSTTSRTVAVAECRTGNTTRSSSSGTATALQTTAGV